jgi:hypothetical protein
VVVSLLHGRMEGQHCGRPRQQQILLQQPAVLHPSAAWGRDLRKFPCMQLSYIAHPISSQICLRQYDARMFGKQFISAGFYLYKVDDISDRLKERNDTKQQLVCTILASQRDRMCHSRARIVPCCLPFAALHDRTLIRSRLAVNRVVTVEGKGSYILIPATQDAVELSYVLYVYSMQKVEVQALGVDLSLLVVHHCPLIPGHLTSLL